MTGRARDRAAFDELARAMTWCRDRGTSGTLRLDGLPGGTCRYRDGRLVLVESAGSPGVSSLLLRSGRVSETDWTAALRAAAGSGSVSAGLVAGGSIGPAGLRVVYLMAVQDAAFAIAAGGTDGCAVDPGPVEVPVPLAAGVDPDWLLAETARRLDALDSLPVAVCPNRERVAPAPGAALPDLPLTAAQSEILPHANGRRSARDIAFLTSRGVYQVTVEISRMVGDGLLEVVQFPAESDAPSYPVESAGGPPVTDSTLLLPRRLPRLLKWIRKDTDGL